jgi:hypothetical protein
VRVKLNKVETAGAAITPAGIVTTEVVLTVDGTSFDAIMTKVVDGIVITVTPVGTSVPGIITGLGGNVVDVGIGSELMTVVGTAGDGVGLGTTVGVGVGTGDGDGDGDGGATVGVGTGDGETGVGETGDGATDGETTVGETGVGETTDGETGVGETGDGDGGATVGVATVGVGVGVDGGGGVTHTPFVTT